MPISSKILYRHIKSDFYDDDNSNRLFVCETIQLLIVTHIAIGYSPPKMSALDETNLQ